MAGLDSNAHLPVEVVEAARRDVARAQRKRCGLGSWKGSNVSEGSGGSNGSSSRGSSRSRDSGGGSGCSRTGSDSGSSSGSDAEQDERVWSKVFRAFSSWKDKHHAAAQELDGPRIQVDSTVVPQ